MPTQIPAQTIAAYQRATFEVFAVPGFLLVLDQRIERLAFLFDERRVRSAAFITAYNPVGRPTRSNLNEVRQARLLGNLEALGLTSITGIGKDPDEAWDGEPSLLALGISRKDAESLGRKYQQNAIVFAGEDAVPRLVLLR